MDRNTRRNRRTKTHTRQFCQGEWVLLSSTGTKLANRKVSLKWSGPYLVSEVRAEHLYVLTDLNGNLSPVVHGARLRFYEGKQWKPTEEVKDQFLYHQHQYEVNKIVDSKTDEDGDFLLLVDWKGFTENDRTWEPFETLYHQVKESVMKFLNAKKASKTTRLIKSTYFDDNNRPKEGLLVEQLEPVTPDPLQLIYVEELSKVPRPTLLSAWGSQILHFEF